MYSKKCVQAINKETIKSRIGPKVKNCNYSNTNLSFENSMDKFYKVNPTQNLTNSLKAVDDLRQEINAKQLKTNGNLKKAIHDKLRYLWTYNSNSIEGNQLSLGDTIFFLQEGLTVSGKSLKDFIDVQNHSTAIEYLYDVIQGETPVDTHLLRSINQILLHNVDYIAGADDLGKPIRKKVYPGEYKKDDPVLVFRTSNLNHLSENLYEQSYKLSIGI